MGDDISMYQREFPLKTVHHILSGHYDMAVGYEHVWSSSNIHWMMTDLISLKGIQREQEKGHGGRQMVYPANIKEG